MLSSGIVIDPSGGLEFFLIKTQGNIQPEQAIRAAGKAYAQTELGKKLLERYKGITAKMFVENPPPFEFLARFGIRRLQVLPIRVQLVYNEKLASAKSKTDANSIGKQDSII